MCVCRRSVCVCACAHTQHRSAAQGIAAGRQKMFVWWGVVKSRRQSN